MKPTKAQNDVATFISQICGTAPCLMRQIFTRGGCYRFYQILKDRFPEAEAYEIQGHCVTKIAGRFWDITGALPDGDRYRKMNAGMHRIYASCYFDEVHFMCQLAQLKVVQWEPDHPTTEYRN